MHRVTYMMPGYILEFDNYISDTCIRMQFKVYSESVVNKLLDDTYERYGKCCFDRN